MKPWHYGYLSAGIVLGLLVCVLVVVGLAKRTKVVPHTVVKTRTVVETKQVQSRFAGTPASLAAFLRPKTAGKIACPTGLPKGAVCYALAGPKYFVLLAVPS